MPSQPPLFSSSSWVFPKRWLVTKANRLRGMAFLLTSLGSSFLHFSLVSLLLFIPRAAGSLRTIRFLASDLNSPSPTWKYHSANDSSSSFLYTTSPGFFLGLDIPGNATILRLYGYKRAGPSLYGVHLDGYEALEVDGHNASIRTPFDIAPSCLFSLSMYRSSVGRLELYNLHDSRFEALGEITFSHVEYSIEEQGGPTSSDFAHLCESHSDWTRPSRVLRRQASAPSASSPTSSSPAPSRLAGKMDLVIGLVTALITIVVVIFVIATLYILYLRRREQMERLGTRLASEKTTPGGKRLPATKSTMFSPTATVLPELPPKDRYLNSDAGGGSMLSNPTSSFSTHAEVTKGGYGRSTQTTIVHIASPAIRPKSKLGPSATSPPDLPLPIPGAPGPVLVQAGRRGYEASTLLSPPSRLQGDIPTQRLQPNAPRPGTTLNRDIEGRVDRTAPGQTMPSRLHSQQGSDSSFSSDDGRLRTQQKVHYPPSSGMLPVAPPSPLQSTPPPSGSPNKPRAREFRDGGLRTDISTQNRQQNNDLIEMRSRLWTIRESLKDPRLNAVVPQQAAVSHASILHDRARSSEDIRRGAETTRTLRESKSSPELETLPQKMSERWPIESSDSTPANPDGLSNRIVSKPRTRESSRKQDSSYLGRLPPLKLVSDPIVIDWPSHAPNVSSSRSATEGAQRLPDPLPTSQGNLNQGNKVVAQDPFPAKLGTKGTSQPLLPNVTSTRTLQQSLLRPPQHDQVNPSAQDEQPIVAPLTPRKRPLPKIPT